MLGKKVLVLLPIRYWAGLLFRACVGVFLMLSKARYWSSPDLVVPTACASPLSQLIKNCRWLSCDELT